MSRDAEENAVTPLVAALPQTIDSPNSSYGENDTGWTEDHGGDGAASNAPASIFASVTSSRQPKPSTSEDICGDDTTSNAPASHFASVASSRRTKLSTVEASDGPHPMVCEPSDADLIGDLADQVGDLPLPLASLPRPVSFRKLVKEGVSQQCQRRIEDIYRRHRPDKLADVEQLMALHRGSERDIYTKVCAKYGVKPDQTLLRVPSFHSQGSDPLSGRQYYRQRIEAVYRAAAPHKLCNMDKLLEAYQGREEELLNLVRSKYCDVLGGTLHASDMPQDEDLSSRSTDPVVNSQFSAQTGDALRYKELISAVYRSMASDKLHDVDRLLSQHAGREPELYARICAKYDLAPGSPTQSPMPQHTVSAKRLDKANAHVTRLYRERIVAVYQTANPEKVRDVDLMLKQHIGSEYEAYLNVCAKYGVVPEPELEICSRCSGAGRLGLCGSRSTCLLSRRCPSCDRENVEVSRAQSAPYLNSAGSAPSWRQRKIGKARPTPF